MHTCTLNLDQWLPAKVKSILACLSYASVEDHIKGKVARSWKVARGLISYMLTHVWFIWMNTCPAQQIMKHCHHDSTQQGLPLINYPACLGDPTVEQSWRWCSKKLPLLQAQKYLHTETWAKHACAGSSHWHALADVASRVKRVCLPLQCDSKQTQSNEIHCREPVSGTLRERERRRDGDAHASHHVRRQSTNSFSPQ